MKKVTLTITAMALALSTAFANGTKKGERILKVDAKKSKMEWFAEKVTGKHNGTIDIASGEVKLSGNDIKSGKFNIDMNTITNTDMQGEYQKKLEGHLKSEDFFSVEKFPTATFEITSATRNLTAKAGEANYTIKGNLTIKGITQEISFPATVTTTKESLTAVGEATVDRSKFNVRYGSKSFFADLGDKVIYDEFKVKLNIVATK